MNLTIDQGNSSAKVSIFDKGEIIAEARFDSMSPGSLLQFIKDYPVDAAVYSSVQQPHPEIMGLLRNNVKTFIYLDENTPMPVVIDYATPSTLGHDRIAAAIGANTYAPGKNALIIDAGTAVTLDIVTADGHFKGGNISPGLKMRFEALNNFTSRLPLVNYEGDIPDIGYDTVTAIRSGVVGGLVAEIENFIDRMAALTGGDLTVIMTGGDSHFLAGMVQRETVVVENLLAIGLNRILSYNENI